MAVPELSGDGAAFKANGHARVSPRPLSRKSNRWHSYVCLLVWQGLASLDAIWRVGALSRAALTNSIIFAAFFAAYFNMHRFGGTPHDANIKNPTWDMGRLFGREPKRMDANLVRVALLVIPA